MKDTEPEADESPLSGVRQYQVVCAAGLIVMALPLFARGLGVWSFLPLMVGVVAGLLTWRAGPYLVLLSFLFLVVCDRMEVTPVDLVAGCLMCGAAPFDRANSAIDRSALDWGMEDYVPLLDAVLAAGLLAYLMGAFRLLSVQKNILPVDPRRRVRQSARRQETRVGRLPPPKPQVRSDELVRPKESLSILIVAISGAVVAFVAGGWLLRRNVSGDLDVLRADVDIDFDMGDETWQLIVLVWVVGLVLLALSGVLTYVGMLRRTPEEAQLYLQDELWKETRREQSRINRWLAWAALDWRRNGPAQGEKQR